MNRDSRDSKKSLITDERYRLLIEAVDSIRDYAIFLLDPHGNIVTWNEGAERIKGYRPSEIIGRNFTTFYTQEDLDRNHPAEELVIAAREGTFAEEGWRLRKDGRRFWASVLITRLTGPNGEILGFSKVTRDLTERRRNEEALRNSEERFRRLVESVKDYAIFAISAEGIVTSWNEGAQRLKGYRADEIIGQHFSKFYPLEAIRRGHCERELEEAARSGRYEDEGWRVRKDGTKFWASVVITAMRDNAGKIVGYSKVTRDLTERRRAEEELRHSNEELERRVALRTDELSRALQDIERALRTRDEFLSIASHELKTPITSLKIQAEVLYRRFGAAGGAGPDPDKVLKSVSTILRQADRLSALVDYMLDVSRVQLGRFTFDFRSARLSELLESVVEQWREPLLAAGCELSVQIEPGVAARIDPYRLEQVVANLLSNVIKYAPGAPVSLRMAREGGWAVIVVCDQGPGIDPRFQGKLFERFERISAPAGISGFGLGLFIAKTIVSAHGGTIGIDSDLGKGTLFTVRIPIDGGGEAPAKVPLPEGSQ